MSLHVYRFAFSHSITSVLFIYGMTLEHMSNILDFLVYRVNFVENCGPYSQTFPF